MSTTSAPVSPRAWVELIGGRELCAMRPQQWPPHRGLVARRVERAKTLLCASNLPVSEIAGAVGFASPSHFGAVFRRSVGASPRAYRDAR